MYARDIHAYEVHSCEMHVCEVQIHEMHACEAHAHEIHANEVHAYKVHAHAPIVIISLSVGSRAEVTSTSDTCEMHTQSVEEYDGFQIFEERPGKETDSRDSRRSLHSGEVQKLRTDLCDCESDIAVELGRRGKVIEGGIDGRPVRYRVLLNRP